MTKLNIFTIVAVVAFLVNPFFSFAQNSIDTITIATSPTNPEPGQSVTASVSALQFNIDLAKIVWSVGGKTLLSGQGVRSVSFAAPAAGKSATLSVTVTPQGGTAVTRSIEIAVGGTVDLIWESVDGYTPPFYRGKTLPIKQSTIKVVAMPQVKTATGASSKPGDFVYTWRKDGKNMAGQSGLGDNSIVFMNQILDTGNRIDVSATNGAHTVSESIAINLFNPEIIFYQYDQVKSMPHYEKSFVSNSTISQPRLTLVAEPYFLARDWESNSGTTLNWTINRTPAKAGEKNTLGIITAKGISDVEVEYKESQKLFRDIKSAVRFTVQ